MPRTRRSQSRIKGKGIVNALLNRLPLPELHLSLPDHVPSEFVDRGSFNRTGKYSYCGPFTKYAKRVSEGYKGVNDLDKACRLHDEAYNRAKDTDSRNLADYILAQEAVRIINNPNSPEYEKADAKTVAAVMTTKSKFGLGINTDNEALSHLYYQPGAYFQSAKQLAAASNIPLPTVRSWLSRQAIWQIYQPPCKRVPRPQFAIHTPNEAHQADILYLPHDKVGSKTYKYALTVVDVASRYKAAVPLTDKKAAQVAEAFKSVYNDPENPLTWPSLLFCDEGGEFKQATSELMAKNNVKIRLVEAWSGHRTQGIVERFNRTLAEKLFRHQTAQEFHLPKGQWSTEWVKNLPRVVEEINSTVTRLLGIAPKKAITMTTVPSQPATPPKRPVGHREKRLEPSSSVRFLLSEEMFAGRRRATDPIWSTSVHEIVTTVVREGQPVLYTISGKPHRSFVREELQVIPADTELPPKAVLMA